MSLTSLTDLEGIRARHLPRIEERLRPGELARPSQVLVCTGTGCASSGSVEIYNALRQEVRERGLDVTVTRTGCFGFCGAGPIVVVHPGAVLYCGVKEDQVRHLTERHLEKGRVVPELLYREGETARSFLFEVPFFARQHRVVLENSGLIDPEDIEEYIARDGYFALAHVLSGMTPEEVTRTVSASGLRGRGGAGFPTGRKWAFAAAEPGPKKYIVCNADEGDPGAFMDRSILEGNPHAVLEGMAIAAYAVGADEGFVYARIEYPLAVKRLEIAIRQARKLGLLGKDILGSEFSFDVDIALGAGAFVCGEETALLNSAMGLRGEPRVRPPFPAQAGLYGKPTVINNVETLANVPAIIRRGAAWYAAMGTERSKGTKIFSLAGKIRNTGLVEVPMGMPLGSLVYDIGGGPPPGRRIKAVQTGGPSGGAVPADRLDVPIDYESFRELGTIVGSGGLIVLDDRDCMVDLAKFYMQFARDESCGRCTPCRVGTAQMVEILERITAGAGTLEDLDELDALAGDVQEASLCGLGQTAANPVLSTLRYFRGEYLAHIKDHYCPAGVCNLRVH
ncbi:MAG: NADH-ubiquinone oxidoreductase-F iron-sulfur binding region domain-containing protein [Bacillota bacterium]|nr:NADH-ubiquinone oxidoreductase-F iron-sulfur binding region domain-containing protein [Bacillota bacterium]